MDQVMFVNDNMVAIEVTKELYEKYNERTDTSYSGIVYQVGASPKKILLKEGKRTAALGTVALSDEPSIIRRGDIVHLMYSPDYKMVFNGKHLFFAEISSIVCAIKTKEQVEKTLFDD